ncbi:MAG: CDGSH iron-sulfur domain-containing protein [Candidatus Methanoplasma sp.]|nr:CDGSH iron-sulfur domain-containing protein [Candidatus Methanoplasma sp.]
MPCDDGKIEVTRNGPYLVSGGVPLSDGSIKTDVLGKAIGWKKGEPYGPAGAYALCRCGMSGEKPFCDGSHAVGFDGTETAHMGPFEEGAGVVRSANGVDLLQDPRLCTGSGFCHGRDDVGRTMSKEKTLGVAKAQCADCAGGSLTLRIGGELSEEELPREILVTTASGRTGPLRVTGGIPVSSQDRGDYADRNRVALCRCGKSRNKPFCDGAHLR